MKLKKLVKLNFLFLIILIQPSIFSLAFENPPKPWGYSMRTFFNRSIDLFESFNATSGYRYRQSYFRNDSKTTNGLNAQSVRIYLNVSVNNETIENDVERLFDIEGMEDFAWSTYVRLLYLDINKTLIDSDVKNQIIYAFGHSKFWFTESTETNTEIVFTENHQILCHTAEYLIGQLFPNDTFTYSGITGQDHVDHAVPLIKKWLDYKTLFGFAEWNANGYLNPDISSLVNLVDFAMDEEIIKKAAMILDQITFGFACNYYKNRFATSQGRCYDDNRATGNNDGISEAAWILLGIGEHSSGKNGDRAAVHLATSDHYAPPPILEAIYLNASQNFEHKERHSIDIDEGDEYNISYTEEDLMFWWSLSAPYAPETVEASFDLLEKYSIDPETIIGPQLFVDFVKWSAFFHGMSLSDYCQTLRILSKGSALETASVYTYRTPYYQLSGAQDHMKGMCGQQEHIWQASLDDTAYIFTNSPGGITKNLDQMWMGGWKPRATFYKNMGIIQYDREVMPIEGEILIFLLNLIKGGIFYQHAYFPRNEFDEVQQIGKWTFGQKGDGYVGLYSFEPTWWQNRYELRVNGYKNIWITELGSKEEFGSFDNFTSKVSKAPIAITPLALGFNVLYTSPSRGEVSVGWDEPFKVAGTNIDLGPYPRFDNKYCHQDFATRITEIEFNSTKLILNFENLTRLYQP